MSIKCRCCYNEGKWHLLETKDSIFNIKYCTMLEDTFNIEIIKPNHYETRSGICEKCRFSLKEAYLFKKQVLFCEDNFKQYINSDGINTNSIYIKPEVECYNDDFHCSFKVETNIDDEREVEEPCGAEDPGDESVNKEESIVTDHNIKDDKSDSEDNIHSNAIDEVIDEKDVEIKHDAENIPNVAKKGVKKKLGGKTALISLKGSIKSLLNTVETESGTIYSCVKCNKTYKSKQSAASHVANYHNGPYKCPKCDHLCSHGYGLRAHYRKHGHITKPGEVCQKLYSKQNVKRAQFKCDLCSKVFKHKRSLKNHMYLHTGGKPIHLCETCGMRFNDRTNLNIHERIVHLKLRPFTCDHCKTTYTAKKHLKSHIITKHLDLKEFRCSFCGDMFGTKSLREKHEESHNKVFRCCHLTFESKGEYLSHVRKFKCIIPKCVDIGSRKKYLKPRSCEHCGKTFVSKFSWRRHVLQKHSSTRIRNVTCEICSQKFYEIGSLNRHKFKRHIPNIIRDKSKCNVCHRSYRNLEKHMQSHTDTPFSCNVCGKLFSEVSSRNHHVKYVHSVQRYSCSICERRFKEKGALRRHMMRAHDVKDGNDFDDYMSAYIINKGQYQ